MCGGKCKTKQKNRKVFHKKVGVSASNEMERFGVGAPDNTLRAREAPDAVLGIVDHLRRRFARLDLSAHFLDL